MDAAKHKQQVASLEKATKEEQVKILNEFQASFKKAEYADPEVVKDIFHKSNMLSLLATQLETNKAAWGKTWPGWVNGLLDGLSNCSAVPGLFPVDQFRALSNAFRGYVMSGNWSALHAYSLFVCFDDVKRILLQDVDLYNTLKKEIQNEDVLQFFYNIASYEEWQHKLLEDKQFTHGLLALPENNDVWDVFAILAYNKDAKELLPREVLTKANNSSYVRCTDICALLCNDADLNTLKLDDSWITRTANLLQILLTEGRVVANGVSYDILDLILPIANFSSVFSKQDAVGKRVVALLLQVVSGDLPKTYPVQGNLERARFEAGFALWNLSYLDSNRNLINANDGVTKLKNALASTTDKTLRKAIDGTLYMLSAPFSAPPLQTSGPSAGHIMLSYNWGCQATVVRIAKSLQNLGFKVWLDVEQMKGDTLEAMAGAIEQSDLVLICMSQKYKDSANCRLEGEYCVNRKVAFIPLMMQQGYRPDGWLGITLGSRLYYDFTDEKDWDKKIAELVKALGDHGKGNAVKRIETAPASPAVGGRKPVAEWTLQDIQEWLKTEQLDHHSAAFKQHKFDGKALVELKNLLAPQKPALFSYIGELLRISRIEQSEESGDTITKLLFQPNIRINLHNHFRQFSSIVAYPLLHCFSPRRVTKPISESPPFLCFRNCINFE